MASAPISSGLPSVPSEEFRIEFEDHVFPPPVSRLASPVEEEDFETRLQQTQEELLQLKHQARLVERRKDELEEINRKEREFTKGRTEVHEKLTRVLVTLEKEATEARRRLEAFLEAKHELTRKHRTVSGLRPENWDRAEIGNHLDEALTVIKEAQLDFERTMKQVEPLLTASPLICSDTVWPSAPMLPQGFLFWVRAGFAFTLPLVVIGVIALVVSIVF